VLPVNIFKHEFKTILRSAITWSLSIAALLFVFLSLYPEFSKSAAILDETLSKFPPELLMAFGMNDMDMSTVLGFYSIAFLLCQICLAIQAANYGFALVSVEERDMTADFLLAKPVGRPAILTSKFLAGFSGMTITNLAVWVSSLVFLKAYSAGRSFDMGTLLLLLASIVVFQLFFFSVGLLISLLVRRVRSVTPFSMALAFGMYILSAFGSMLGEVKLEILTPFKQFEPNYIVRNGAYDLPLAMISVTVILISIVGSYLLYMRRDIHSAV
jgi:ABC-2 type transport system permease protein